MRSYGQDSNTSPLALESSAQPSSSVLSLYGPGHSSAFTSAPTYPHDNGNSFYAPTPTNFLPHIDHQRPRVGSSTSAPGMAQALRHTTLPHPGTQLSTRDVYSPSTPTYPRRGPEHSRSPPYPPGGLRRYPISSIPSPNLGFTHTPGLSNMANQYPASKQQQNIPPLQDMRMLGSLAYSDAPGNHIKPDINGTIDKGFFLADNEWTCYRRNYFSCICSFHIPASSHPQAVLNFTPSGSTQSYQVAGWAMCISAVVSENDAHTIELVQHTPKRDKGPIAPPDKIRLNPKTPQAAHHPLGHYAGADMGLAGSSRAYEQNLYGQMPHPSMHASLPTEHTFERIQFKQATANNGKRRAAQQYYHLVVELYADIGPQGQGNDQFIKVAQKKSAKMIVRGRSPGHYQNERRTSTSSGPGAGGSGMGGYGGSGPGLIGGGYSALGNQSMGGGYGGYDTRSSNDHYRTHSDAIPMEPMLGSEESKGIHESDRYQYYPATIVEPHHDARQPIELFTHPTSRPGDSGLRNLGTGFDLTSKLYAGPLFGDKSMSSGRFEGKSSSSGYYPVMMPPAVGLPRADSSCKQESWRTSMSPMVTSSTS